jgi:hypothetical protein
MDKEDNMSSGPTYRILCADGECRHSAPFATAQAASNWLANNHSQQCGTAEYHEVEVTDVNGVVWPAVDARALPIQIRIDRERLAEAASTS